MEGVGEQTEKEREEMSDFLNALNTGRGHRKNLSLLLCVQHQTAASVEAGVSNSLSPMVM